jgi:hypothetical protein
MRARRNKGKPLESGDRLQSPESKEIAMNHSSVNTLGDAAASRRPRSAFWRAVERVAAACTTGELGALADHYQVGQPALAARFRAAVPAAQGHRA